MEWKYSLMDINNVANDFWKRTAGTSVFAFHGEMGSGKTTFIHALCDVKGINDVVGSPTFSIINEYEYDCEGTKKVLFHLDLYRIKSEEEGRQAGVEDVLFSNNICLVEWPENAPGLFPEYSLPVFIELVDSKTRLLRIGNI